MRQYQKDGPSVGDPSIFKLKNPTASVPLADVFQGLPSDFLREIDGRSKLNDFAQGHVFFKTGQTGQGLFLLEQGAVQTFRTSGKKS